MDKLMLISKSEWPASAPASTHGNGQNANTPSYKHACSIINHMCMFIQNLQIVNMLVQSTSRRFPFLPERISSNIKLVWLQICAYVRLHSTLIKMHADVTNRWLKTVGLSNNQTYVPNYWPKHFLFLKSTISELLVSSIFFPSITSCSHPDYRGDTFIYFSLSQKKGNEHF